MIVTVLKYIHMAIASQLNFDSNVMVDAIQKPFQELLGEFSKIPLPGRHCW